MPKLGFIGAGTTGTALAVRLNSKTYPVIAIASRNRSSAARLAGKIEGCSAYGSGQNVADAADLVFITTPDEAIAPVASGIRWHAGQGVVHCCGSESTGILDSAKKYGALTGTFHPLQTFASVEKAMENIPGSTIAVEAEPPLLETLKNIASTLDARWIELKAKDRVIYHSSAVIACNYLVTLIKMATDLWQSFGIPQRQAVQALLPLVKGTIRNIETVGIPDCLTGPIARGDISTIEKHLLEIEKAAPNLLSTYRELGLKTVPIALGKGKIDKERGRQMETVLTGTMKTRSTKRGT
jgi:predicted short-subunit dehydrogenase-like oxidoreductase (DUF2520 family)